MALKIAYILPSLANRGPVIVINKLANKLIDLGYFVHVFYFDDIKDLVFNCHSTRINISEIINFDDFDIIHSNGYRPDKYVSKWSSKITRAKLVTTIHSDITKDLKYTYNWAISLLFSRLWLRNIRKIHNCVVISDQLSILYGEQFRSVNRIYNGVDISIDPSRINPIIKARIQKLRINNTKILGSYANITKIKGLEQLVKLLKVNLSYAAVIIGCGPARSELEMLAGNLKVSDRILFLDYLDQPYNYLLEFDAYIMPSRSEGFGMALVEAALGQCPIVCSDINVFRELFTSNDVNFFELDDLYSLNSAVTLALSSVGKEKINNAYVKAQSFYNVESMAQNYLTLYRKVIHNEGI